MMEPAEAKSLVFKHWRYLVSMARRRFPHDSHMAEQAVDYMLDKLARDDWRRVSEYAGDGFTAFITVVANRLFTDYARKMGEGVYIPKWLREQDMCWQRAYFLLCIRHLSKPEAIETLSGEYPDRDPAFIHDVVHTIARREQPKLKPRAVSSEALIAEEPAGDTLIPEETLSEMENQTLLDMVFTLIEQAQQNTESTDTKAHEWVKRLRGCLTLDSEEYLLLCMVYRDGLNVSEAGRRLQLNTNQAQGRHRRLLARLRETFEQTGLAEELKLLIS